MEGVEKGGAMLRRTVVLTVLLVVALAGMALAVVAIPAGIAQPPKTGQTTCWNWEDPYEEIPCTGTGQDGEIQAGVAWPDLRFAPGEGIEADCMIDNLTGLMWKKDANSSGLPWENSLHSVTLLNSSGGLCGFSDWRMPNVNELQTLLHAGVPNSKDWLQAQGFTNVSIYPYWTSTTLGGYADAACTVNPNRGDASYGDKDTYTWYVWPVRGGEESGAVGIPQTGQKTSYYPGDDGDLQKGVSWPAPRFLDPGDGTVTDNLTGLMWARDAYAPGPPECTPEIAKTWKDALDHALCLNTYAYLGYGDWRLPNWRELESLMDRSRVPALPEGHPFTNVVDDFYWWSSSTNPQYPDTAWFAEMSYGYLSWGYKGSEWAVWPVRNGGTGPAFRQLTVAKSGTGKGKVTSIPAAISCGAKCAKSLAAGTKVTLTAAPNKASAFTGWSGGGCSGTGECALTLTADTTVHAEFTRDTTPPLVTVTATPATLWPADGTMVNVTVGGSASDSETGIASVVITVNDEYDQYNLTVPGFGSVIQLEAWRQNKDKNGRKYTIKAVAKDGAGNRSNATTTVIVPPNKPR
jgi:hypothetical protein